MRTVKRQRLHLQIHDLLALSLLVPGCERTFALLGPCLLLSPARTRSEGPGWVVGPRVSALGIPRSGSAGHWRIAGIRLDPVDTVSQEIGSAD